MKRTTYLSVLFLVFISFHSCQDELIVSELEEIETKELGLASSQDEVLRATAQIMAQLQNKAEVKSLLKNEISKLPGGEKTVFYLSVKDKLIANSNATFSDLMTEKAKELGFQTSSTFFKDEVLAVSPKLSFTLFLHNTDDVTQWDLNQSVVVIPETKAFGGIDAYQEVGYSADGVNRLVSNENEPTFDALVVENNGSFLHISQRPTVDILTKSFETLNITPCDNMVDEIFQSIEDNTSNDYLVYADDNNWLLDINSVLLRYNDCHIQEIRVPEPSARNRDTREEREEIKAARVDHSDLKKFCKWWKSTCKIEVQLTFFELNSQNTISPTSFPKKYIVEDRRDMKRHRVFWTDLQMYKWEHTQGSQNHGDKCIYTLIGKHHSPGNSTTYSFNASTGQVKFEQNGLTVTSPGFSGGISHTRTTSDLELGGDMVYYTDPSNGVGTMYMTGIVDFWVKEHE